MIMQKFIISKDGELILGNVGYHFELLGKNYSVGCYGGGCWEIDEESKTLFLGGESTDFGPPKWEYFRKLPEEYEDYKIIYKGEEIIIPEEKTSEVDNYTKYINSKILEEMKKPKSFDLTKGLFNNFKFNDGYEVKAKNKKDATRKHNAWKRRNKKAKN